MTKNDIKHLCCLNVLLGCLLGCLFSSCHRESIIPISPDEFTKDQQEVLGKLIQESIALDQQYFEFLPSQHPYDSTVYWFIQKLYNQATNVMRVDHQSPTDNSWTPDRDWAVHVLQSDEINAFILPGGYFYITTGFLNTLNEEYELYYILSFEANLMNEGLLLERLVSEVNANKLLDIINRKLGPENEDVKKLARIISALEFNADEVYKNDVLAVNSICNTSQWNRMGLLPILETSDDNMEWLIYRPSHINRGDWLLNFQPDYPEDCGTLKTNNPSNEGYQRYVLDQLN